MCCEGACRRSQLTAKSGDFIDNMRSRTELVTTIFYLGAWPLDITRDKNGDPLFSEKKQAALEKGFYEMVCLMARLRCDCPWDREQTPDTLKKYILEEAYEVLETIEEQNWDGLKDELGDFVLQALFQAQIQAEEKRFDMEDVLAGLVAKMVRRHPHVFVDSQISADQVATNWETIKKTERGPQDSLFDGFTRGLPALMESYKISKKAARVGFDWPHVAPVFDKIQEEIEELREAAERGDPEHIQEELGDLLFAVSNLVRKYGFEPEETLRAANRKFVKRFRSMEGLARDQGQNLADLDLDAQEALWQVSKKSP